VNSTIKDIAKSTGVSKTTISRVINGTGYVSQETKEKVLAAIKEYNYIPNLIARGLKTSNKFVGVISYDITNPYFTYVIYGIEKRLREDDYTMFHLNSDNDIKMEERNIDELLATRVEGIILLSSLCKPENAFIEKAKKSTRIVSVEGRIDGVDSINTDNVQGTYSAINYLIENGHKNIGICSTNLEVNSWKIRYDTYKSILQEKGIYKENYDFIGKDFLNQLKAAHKQKRLPTSIFALHDNNALLIYNFCYDNDIRIPEDLSIVGFDDLPVSKLVYPRLTTVAQPFEEIGVTAAELLLNKIKNKDRKSTQNVIISTELIVRNSVKSI
jgi:DNA-binding LacI/PurR family transcriptional regulator